MQKLRFTTEHQEQFIQMLDLEYLGHMVRDNSELDAEYAYIHGEAEYMACYDIPLYLDGDIMQMKQPVEMQDIEMHLDNGKVIRINAHYSCCHDHFLLIMPGDEESLYKNMHSDPHTCQAEYCRARYRLIDKPREDAEHAEFMRSIGFNPDEKDYLTGW